MKNTECLNTTNFCVFKCLNVSNATSVFNSRRCSKGMFKIIHFPKITRRKETLYRILWITDVNLTPIHFSSLDNEKRWRLDGSIAKTWKLLKIRNQLCLKWENFLLCALTQFLHIHIRINWRKRIAETICYKMFYQMNIMIYQ